MTIERLAKAARIILVGAPGVGKGTQTERLMKKFSELSAISSGDLLRKNVRERTPLGTRLDCPCRKKNTDATQASRPNTQSSRANWSRTQ